MTPSTTHNTFVIERTYNAPAAQVFRAWADPRRKARWFAGSTDTLGNGYELDFRVGGHETFRGGPPGGPSYSYAAQIRDIVTDRRIVSTYEMHVDGARMSVSVATVELREVRGVTHLILTEQGVFLDDLDTAAQREEGSRLQLEAVAAILAEEAP